MGTIGHQRPLGFLLQTGRSSWAVLLSRHSIGATDFSRLNFGHAAETAIQVSDTTDKSRPQPVVQAAEKWHRHRPVCDVLQTQAVDRSRGRNPESSRSMLVDAKDPSTIRCSRHRMGTADPEETSAVLISLP